jgi:hypothetical protein
LEVDLSLIDFDLHKVIVFIKVHQAHRPEWAAGREAARSRGVRFGRPRKLNSEQEQLARRLIGEGKPVSEVAKTFNVHAATISSLTLAPARSSRSCVTLKLPP